MFQYSPKISNQKKYKEFHVVQVHTLKLTRACQYRVNYLA